LKEERRSIEDVELDERFQATYVLLLYLAGFHIHNRIAVLGSTKESHNSVHSICSVLIAFQSTPNRDFMVPF
jgi:hypothetical protein